MDFAKARMLLDEAEKSHTCLSHGKKASAKDCRKYLMEVKKMMDFGRKESLATLKALPVKSRRKITFEEPVDAHSHVFLKEKNVVSKPEPVVPHVFLEEKNVKPEPEPEPVKKKSSLKPRVKKN